MPDLCTSSLSTNPDRSKSATETDYRHYRVRGRDAAVAACY